MNNDETQVNALPIVYSIVGVVAAISIHSASAKAGIETTAQLTAAADKVTILLAALTRDSSLLFLRFF